MALEIRHNRAEHTHENEQFRRVATSLTSLFNQKNWDGLLIGNPYNDDYSRFRADAILLYTHGLIIIDFKDYGGTIKLPPDDEEFKTKKWHSESEVDKQRIEIKAGSRFINPFRQLKYYREALYEIISNNVILNGNLNPSRTCAANIFSGPIELNNHIPKNLPYYKIVQESDLYTFLYDFYSENKFSEESASALKAIFEAALWEEQIKIPAQPKSKERIIEIDSDVRKELSTFLNEKSEGVLVLESMHAQERDDWMKYILSEAVEFNVPQTEVWTHSARISRKITSRTGISSQSLYSTIYGGSSKSASEDEADEEDEIKVENLQETVPIRSDDVIDSAAVIILHEAHLVTRSLHQSDLLRFGSGRLLEDLIKFLFGEDNERKLICIGDPYSLTYGKDEDSSLHLDTLQELFGGDIRHFRQPLLQTVKHGKLSLRTDLAKRIDKSEFNNLNYPWAEGDLVHVEKEVIASLLRNWFSSPITTEPDKCALVFSNKDARKINLWVKSNCLKNGKELAVNDLLLLNNNIHIPDETGFGQPTKLSNGMFLLVKKMYETIEKPISIRQSSVPVILSFTKIRVGCLSLQNKYEADVWLLNNYFLSDDQLSKDEQIAFRVFVNKKIKEEINKNPFFKSSEYQQLKGDDEYLELSFEEKEAIEIIIKGEKVSTTAKARYILRKYRKKHRKKALSTIAASDPLVNAVQGSYGWALTVHKAIGSNFSQILLNAFQGENRGITNAGYFRWVYSAVTAAKTISYIANPQEINPLMDCNFEDAAKVNEDEGNAGRTHLSFPNYNAEDKYKGVIDTSLNENVIGTVCELSNLLEQHAYFLHSIQKSGDYLTKAHFSLPHTSNHLIIAINNNGQRLVTSIRIQRAEGANEETINQAIQQLFTQTDLEYISDGLVLPSDFRREIYNRWSDILKNIGLHLVLKEAHNYQDVFEARNEKQMVKFRVYYNRNGFFTMLSIIQKSNIQLGLDIQNWLLNSN